MQVADDSPSKKMVCLPGSAYLCRMPQKLGKL